MAERSAGGRSRSARTSSANTYPALTARGRRIRGSGVRAAAIIAHAWWGSTIIISFAKMAGTVVSFRTLTGHHLIGLWRPLDMTARRFVSLFSKLSQYSAFGYIFLR